MSRTSCDAVGADRRPGRHRRHEGGHHHRHQDQHEVAEEGDQRPDRQAAVGDPVPAEPDDGHARTVDDQHHDREEEGHQPPGREGRGGQLGVGAGEALRLLLLPHEGPHDPDAGDLLPEHPVDAVDAVLHDPERRDHPGHHGAHGQDRTGMLTASSQARPPSWRTAMTTPPMTVTGRRQGQVGRHHDQHLDLLDVVGDPGDERRGAEAVDLPGREAGDPVEEAVAHVPAEAHGHLGGEVDRPGR